jgi:drug/metabolite transporter (DMT)-like permease
MPAIPAFAKNGIVIAVIAHGMIGASLVWDKILMKRPGTKNLFSYVFWLGALSVFGVVLVPFGYKSTHLWVIGLAFGVGVVDLIATFFYYEALKMGEASESLAVVGGFTPVATLGFSYLLLSHQMKGGELIGFALMTGGGFVMFLSENFPLKKMLPPVVLAAALFGLVTVVTKIVYNHTNFVTGYVWFTIGTFAGSMALLIPPSWRQQIFAESGQDNPRNRFWYFVNRFLSGLGAFLVVYAISLTHPAMVNAISGVRFAVIFLGAFLLTRLKPSWLKEDFSGGQLATKTLATALVIAGLAVTSLTGGAKGTGSSPAAMRLPTGGAHAGALVANYNYRLPSSPLASAAKQ